VKRLRVPAALVVSVLGACGDDSSGGKDAGTGECQVKCFPDGTDAGVCPSPEFVCVSEERTCPAGCSCSAFCFPRTAEGEMNCPVGSNGPQCANPDRTCPLGCDPVA
jgi:hypothetical protein